jgi:hypothetical protein
MPKSTIRKNRGVNLPAHAWQLLNINQLFHKFVFPDVAELITSIIRIL